MKAIVLLFIRPPKTAMPAMQLSIVSRDTKSNSNPDETKHGEVMANESTAPFWTWFIENPRPVGQGVGAT